MTPDDFQTAWKSQTIKTNVTINTDELLQEVQQSRRSFQFSIFARDLGEIGVAVLMIPVWIFLGFSDDLPWTWYLTIPACLWVIGFTIFDRKRHPRQSSESDETLLQCVKNSLNQVEHQIWLLRNIFWWYLLPFTVSLMAFFAQVCWQATADDRATGIGGWINFLVIFSVFGVFLLVIYGWIYYINQRAIRVKLVPQRKELLTLLENLENESTSETADKIDIPVTVSPFAENGFIRGTRNNPAIPEPRPAVRVAIMLTALVFGMVIFVAVIEFVTSNFSEESTPQASNSSVLQPDSIQQADQNVPDAPADNSLEGLLAWHRDKNKLVGLATMVMVDGLVVDSAVVGERKIRRDVALQIDDRWHVGGITCSITATMIASLVESGQLRWTDTVGDLFPEEQVHEYWKPITLTQLLTNTYGTHETFPPEVTKQKPAFGEQSTVARQVAVRDIIQTKPTVVTRSFISAVGPTIAGAMAEKVTGESWSKLVTEVVFEPLHLKHSGFGPPKSSKERLEQPLGHKQLSGTSGLKYSLGDKIDNSAIMGPALSAHMSLRDMCVYANEHLRGYFRESDFLSTETFKILHTPERNQYAFGWVRSKPTAELPFTVYWHNGSNTMWYALVAFIPEKNMVVAVASNDGDRQNQTVAWEILTKCVMRKQLQAEKPEVSNGAK